MITRIGLNNIACYKKPTVLETDKKVNLIYGLNGTGKSILSNYLYDITDSDYSDCSLEGITTEDILVYNKKFINDYFYESEKLKGIFTLSKENKEAETKISDAEKYLASLDAVTEQNQQDLQSKQSDLMRIKSSSEDSIWEIKTNYSGGDRILEYCLTGLMGSKQALFDYLVNIAKPSEKPTKTIEQIKKDVELIHGDDAQKFELVSLIENNFHEIESNNIWEKEIVGSDDSTASILIRKLNNSDWVKEGLSFLPEEPKTEPIPCPFCQEETVTADILKHLTEYFDVEYDEDIIQILNLLSEYEENINGIESITTYESNPFISKYIDELVLEYNAVLHCLNNNKSNIENKVSTPSKSVIIEDSGAIIESFNIFIKRINSEISLHNERIENKESTLEELNNEFWTTMRWDYDQTFSSYISGKERIDQSIDQIQTRIEETSSKRSAQSQIILEEQKKTVNIDAAIENINSGLLDLGIDGFQIEKHSDRLYTISRPETCLDPFKTLSEGEKMIISFLYFREMCKGKLDETSPNKRKIIVIDDPISSLSHVYIFNIGQMIKNDFTNSDDYVQVFLLTHSLYFFYEITFRKKEKRDEIQKLFRLVKNNEGSKILDMKYDEIQNDYQSYWSIIKDSNQPEALIANCMRNIIEYFFNFVEKTDYYNVFQKPTMQENKYQSFSRYMDRESHSVGQNLFDTKEFDYDIFKEGLRLVFEENGYLDHFEKMMR